MTTAEQVAEAEGLLERARKGIKHRKPITFKEFDLEYQLLTGDDKQGALAGAYARLAAMGVPPEVRHFTDLDDEIAWQILWRATYEAGTDRKFAKSVEELRRYLTIDERDALTDNYLDFEDSHAPDLEALDPATMLAIAEAVKKKRGEALRLLSKYDSRELRICIFSMGNPPST